MKEFASLFKSSIESPFEDFLQVFHRELKLLLGPVSRLEEIEERQLDGVAREIANPESISILERTEGDRTMDVLLMPLVAYPGRLRYILAEGSLRHVDIDRLHLFKWMYETRSETEGRMERFRATAVYDCDAGILSRNVIPQLFDIEKARAEDFGASLGFLIVRLRLDTRSATIDEVRRIMRRTDYLFKLNATDLLLMLVECSAHGSEAILMRLKKSLGNRLVAAGYSLYPQQGETVDDLLSEAEGALV